MASFRILGLPADPFSSLFTLSDEALAARDARRMVVDEKPGFPCRISLDEAEIGEEVLLLAYEHQPAKSPYRSSGPIFVRSGARQRQARVDEVPDSVRTRTISLRAYDARDWIVEAAVCEGEAVGRLLSALFDDARVAYVHLHNAKRGCFACRAERAGALARSPD